MASSKKWLTNHDVDEMVPTQAPHTARFQPVIFSDAGSNLYPLCDMPSDALPKALVPVLNRPMIAFPLQWLVTAGFKSCLLVAPVAEHAALAAALRTLHLLPPNVDAANVDANAKPNVAVTVGVTSATLPGAENLNSSPSSPSITVELLPFGPKVGESVRSLAQPSESVTRVRWGTAQLLYWLAATRKLELDPLIMPVDLIAPQMPLASLLATHLAATPEPPTISCLFYERGAGEGTGKERERDGPANLFTAYSRVPVRVQEGIQAATDGSRRDISVHEPLLVMDSDDVSDKNASDLEVRMSLLWKHPHVRISTALLDSFVYVMRLQPLLPLLEMHPELNSITGQLVPFVVKCGWQTRLSEKAHWMVSPAQAADEPALNERNTIHTPSLPPWTSVTEGMPAAPQLYRPRAEMVIARLRPEAQRPLPPNVLPNSETDKKGASAPSDEAFIARANTVPTYLECNRYCAAGSPIFGQYPLPVVAGSGSVPFEQPQGVPENAPIHPKAQLSMDCIVGAGTRIDERTTIKHSILGRNCVIGKGARIMRSILMDGVHVGDNAKIENCIVGAQSSIGDRSQLKETDVGPQYAVPRGAESKNEKLVAYEDSEEDEEDE